MAPQAAAEQRQRALLAIERIGFIRQFGVSSSVDGQLPPLPALFCSDSSVAEAAPVAKALLAVCVPRQRPKPMKKTP